MGLSCRILAQNSQLLQHTPLFKRNNPSGTSTSFQKKQKRIDQLTPDASTGTSEWVETGDGSLDRDPMETNGIRFLSSTPSGLLYAVEDTSNFTRAPQDRHNLTSNPAIQQSSGINIHLEYIVQQWWGPGTHSADFNIQEEEPAGEMEELDEAGSDTQNEGMEMEENSCWDKVTAIGFGDKGISALDRLGEHFVHDATSIGMDTCLYKVHEVDVVGSKSITIC
ncbi:hypothetical protein APHAL10511_004259 [Amanita phalloides]|nr:hypothetical protein APHAL10511_004259 [Amanita phalloides]